MPFKLFLCPMDGRVRLTLVRLIEFSTVMTHELLKNTVRFVNDFCTDFMTETDPASPYSFVDEKRTGQRICTEVDFKRKGCSKHANIKV